MPGPHPAVAATRRAVREALAAHLPGLASGRAGRPPVLVACSGGADSLALAAATAFEASAGGAERFAAGALVVDHGLQAGSDAVAATAAQQCADLGLAPVEVLTVRVADGGDGPESAARDARMQALRSAAERLGAGVLLLGHTRDDHAEQVLLGLARGSGARSLSGMPSVRPIAAGSPVLLVRPFLSLSRETTERAVAAAGLTAWHDPHNADPRFARVRARRALAVLEESLGPGVAAALARSADLLRLDADALDELADSAYASLGEGPWPVDALLALTPAVRLRVWRRAARDAGAAPGALSATHLAACDALVTRWHGQGPVDLPGGHRIGRTEGRVWSGRDGQG